MKAVDFGRIKSRGENSILNGFPKITDARFEAIDSNYEAITKYKNTKATTTFKSILPRKPIWGDPSPQPAPKDIDYSKLGSNQKSIIAFAKYEARDLTLKPSLCNTDQYDLD